MAKKRSKKPEPVPASGPMAALVRTVLTLIAAAVLIWIAAILFARTDGFRSMVESRLEAALGFPLEIGGSSATAGGILNFRNVQTADGVSDGSPGISIAEAEVDVDWWKVLKGEKEDAVRSIVITEWRVNFVRNPDGRMEPEALVAASDWLGKWGGLALPEGETPVRTSAVPRGSDDSSAEGASGDPVSADAWEHTRVALHKGIIEWWDQRDAALVSIHDISVYLTPLVLPTRSASHIHVISKSAVLPGDQRVRDMDLELLRAGDSYLVLNLHAVRPSFPRGILPELKRTKREPEIPPVVAAPPPAEPIVVEVPVTPPPTESSVEAQIRSELEDALRVDSGR